MSDASGSTIPLEGRNYLARDEAEMLAVGGELGHYLGGGQCWYFNGELGAGKTTLVRGMLRALGFGGAVRSPTFTLVESYRFPDFDVHHFDLYRLESAAELEDIGFRDYFGTASSCLVEWPEKGAGCLPDPDWQVIVEHTGAGRRVIVQRHPVGSVAVDS